MHSLPRLTISKRKLITAGIVIGFVSLASFTFGILEYGRGLATREALIMQAESEGAGEKCHTCPYRVEPIMKTAESLLIVGGILAVMSVALFAVTCRKE